MKIEKILLSVIKGPDKGTDYYLNSDESYVLGRKTGKGPRQLCLADNLVSSRHLKLHVEHQQCLIHDIDSRNGTFVIRQGQELKLFYIRGTKDFYRQLNHLVSHYECTETTEMEDQLILMDDDIIVMGNTHLRVKFLPDSPATACCVQCGNGIPLKSDTDGKSADFHNPAQYMCPGCLTQFREQSIKPTVYDYSILKLIGSGQFSKVYLARQNSTNRIVALKTQDNMENPSDACSSRFEREINIMRDLDHPNLVRIHDYGMTREDHYYFSAEYMNAGNCSKMIIRNQRTPYGFHKICFVILQILKGLIYLHERGYVHRDIKPANILFKTHAQADCLIKLGDFGISRSYRTHGDSVTSTDDYPFGTYPYWSPEQILDIKNINPAADIYSLGIVLYEMVSGQYPFSFSNRRERAKQALKSEKMLHPVQIILNQEPVLIQEYVPEIPAELADIIHKAISKIPDERFRSAQEFHDAILHYTV